MSDTQQLDMREQIARIDRAIEETRKFTAEQHKLQAVQQKLAAEQQKFDRERWLVVAAWSARWEASSRPQSILA